jgi:hypothetical protein
MMGHIPKNAKWYVAEIVEEITVEDDPRNVVHINLVLIRADSPDEAYELALQLGKRGETEYENPSNKQVSIRFRGLKSLGVVYDGLEHGAEIQYSERIAMPKQEIEKLITSKEQLDVFTPISQPTGPDYSSREILEEAMRIVHQDSEAQNYKTK